MEKENCITTALETGIMSVYNFGTTKIHAYKTNDPIDNEVFVIEKDSKGFVLEYPCFFANIKELETYLSNQNITIEGIVAAYHMAGATFLSGIPVYTTKEADEYGRHGGGKALIDNFTAAFGESFDSSIPENTSLIEGNTLKLADITMHIIRNADAFDVEIPELNVVYTHMLGHDCHSIVAGDNHADALIAQLKGYQDQGIDLVLTSHYTPEDLKDVQTKIDYLENLKAIAKDCSNAADFKSAIQKVYPEYSGENYLDMTSGFFFEN